jgi:transcriptional regulator of acetoin/glycerol metabolism
MGASDYITKPFDRDEILLATQKVLERRRLLDEIEYLRKQLSERYSFGHMVSRNAAMLELFATVEMLAESDTTVVIVGESGTGKELVARALHFQGKRKAGRFVAINCAGLPEQLLESELFGFEKGAFTGATQERVGKIEFASGGTLFLDEIESIPLSMQMKLLRVLEVRSIERLGGNRQIPVALPAEPSAGAPEGHPGSERGGAVTAHRLQLAGQHPRAHERARAGDAADEGRGDPGGRRRTRRGDAAHRRRAHRPARRQQQPVRRAAQGGIGPSARHAAVDQATLHRKIKAHGLRPGSYRGRNGNGPTQD